MERSPADIPLSNVAALAVADDLLSAFEQLSLSPLATESSLNNLIACVDHILDFVYAGNGWIQRIKAVAIASVLLDDGYIPLHEHTLHQPLALAMLEHHDHLLDLIDQWP